MPREPRPPRRDGKLELLSSVPAFSRCRRNDLVELGRLLELLEPEAGDVLADSEADTGAGGPWRGLVVEGHALAVHDGVPEAVLGPGSWWGWQAGSWGDDADRSLVVALGPMWVLAASPRCWPAVAGLVPGAAQPPEGFAPLKNRSNKPSTPAPWSVMPPSTTMV
ncbi:MAG TPA: hypothetical protein VKR22_08245 [Acidimicrobiales bacterium]|nr:hypothetical protein [Acidimicrobiales bacterium]